MNQNARRGRFNRDEVEEEEEVDEEEEVEDEEGEEEVGVEGGGHLALALFGGFGLPSFAAVLGPPSPPSARKRRDPSLSSPSLSCPISSPPSTFVFLEDDEVGEEEEQEEEEEEEEKIVVFLVIGGGDFNPMRFASDPSPRSKSRRMRNRGQLETPNT